MPKRFIHFNRFGAYVGELTPLQATRTRSVDQCGVDKVELILLDNGIDKYDRIVFTDSLRRTCEWIVMSSRESRASNVPVCKVNCYGSMQELSRHFMPTLRRGSGDSPAQALKKALDGTRWSVGPCDEGNGTYSVYHQSSLKSIEDIADAYKMEVKPLIELSLDGNSIARRSVCLVKRIGRANTALRLDYGSGLSGIDRVLSADDVVTRLYCYGKGVQTTDEDGNATGGYSRKITFAEINGGKEYVQDDSLLQTWGVYGPDGTLVHAEGIFEDGDCEDKATLLAEGKAALAERSKPVVSYEGTVEALGRAGFDANACDLGDNLQMVDTTFPKPLRLTGRVLEIVEDLLGDGSPSSVKVGNIIEGITKRSDRVQQTIDRLTGSAGSWDDAATLGSSYLNGVIDGLNNVMNQTGGYTYIKPGKGLYVYDRREDDNPTMCIQIGGGYFRIADGKNADGTWNFRTLGNGHGLVADAIVSGIIDANLIRAGVLQDKTGTNYWNLDTGDFRLAAGAQLGGKDIATTDAVIKSVDVEYAQGDSRTVAPTTGWETYAPDWVDGKYIWTRTKTVMQSGDVAYSDPVCISGADGQQGASGKGINAIVEQYYLSTSDTAQVNGSWSSQQPAWSKGKYIWTRSKIAWTDGTVSYTTPCLAKAINGANQMAGSAIKSTVKLYAKNQSDTVPPTDASNPELGWSEEMPTWSDGYYIWSMKRITMGDDTVRYTTPVLESAYNKACQSAHDLDSSLTDLDSTVQDLAKDGVVTEAEKAAVKKAMQNVDKEREELSDQYRTLKANSALNSQYVLNVLTPKYTAAFGSTAEGGTYGEYRDRVNDVLKCKTAEALETAILEYNSAYSAYSTAVKEYAAAATAAQHAIEQKNANDYADGILSAYDEQLGQQKIFNRLTNNGATQGVYMESGKLYINASYMSAGTIADVKGRNSWNLKTGELTTNYMTANNITAGGTFKCGSSSYYTMLNSTGQMAGYRPTTGESANKVAYIDFTASTYNNVDKKTYYGIQMQAQGSVRISSPSISTAATSSTSVTTTTGRTETISQQLVSSVRDNGNTISWTYGNFTLGMINGLVTSVGLVGT